MCIFYESRKENNTLRKINITHEKNIDINLPKIHVMLAY